MIHFYAVLSHFHTVLTHSYAIEPFVRIDDPLLRIDDPLVSIAITKRKKGLTPLAFIKFKTDIIETWDRGS